LHPTDSGLFFAAINGIYASFLLYLSSLKNAFIETGLTILVSMVLFAPTFSFLIGWGLWKGKNWAKILA